jgi:hypothetical protein
MAKITTAVSILRHDTHFNFSQQNDTQQNDAQQNDTQHNVTHHNIENATLSI